MDDREEKLKRAAKLYAEKEGKELLSEVEEIRRQNVSYMTPRADQTVRRLVSKAKRPKRRKAVFAACAAAACVIITVSVVTNLPGGVIAPPGADTPSSDSGAADMLPGEPGMPDVMPAEIQPILFELPADYQVSSADFDNGLSVYALKSGEHGSIVLTMHYKTDAEGNADRGRFEGFDEVIIDGTAVPAKVHATYKLLAFDFGDTSFTLSSEDDLGSLAAVYRNIAEKYSKDL